MQEKPYNFFSKIWQSRQHNKKPKWIRNMAKKLERLKEIPKEEIHVDLPITTLQKYKIAKMQGLDEYMDYDSRISPPFVTD